MSQVKLTVLEMSALVAEVLVSLSLSDITNTGINAASLPTITVHSSRHHTFIYFS